MLLIKFGKHKICSYCKEKKNIDSFYKNKSQSDGCDYYCKKCKLEQTSRSYKKNCLENPEKMKARWRERSKEIRKTPKRRFWHSRDNAKRRGLKWDITYNKYKALISKKCTYCFSELDKTGIGLDRINNNKGYLLNNVTSCCGLCNYTRSTKFNYKEMLQLGLIIKKIKVLRRNNVK